MKFILLLSLLSTTALADMKAGAAVMQGHETKAISYRVWVNGDKSLDNQFGASAYIQGETVSKTKDSLYSKGTLYRKSDSGHTALGLFIEGNFEQYQNDTTFSDRRVGISFEMGLLK